MRDCPGRRRSSSDCTKSISMVIPAGNPSITPPMPLPCDSPKLVRRRILPNELNISIALRVYNEVNVPVCLVIKGFDFIKVTIFFVKRFKNDNKSFISRLLENKNTVWNRIFLRKYVRVFNNVKNAYNSSYMKKRTSIFY